MVEPGVPCPLYVIVSPGLPERMSTPNAAAGKRMTANRTIQDDIMVNFI
jgi:hypothetical protein